MIRISVITITFLFSLCGLVAQNNRVYTIVSPDGTLKAEIATVPSLSFRVMAEGETVLASSPLGMTFSDGTVWGGDSKVMKVSRTTVDRIIPTPFYKKSEVREYYHQLSILFKGGYGVEFRAYDDGIAYRFRYLDDKPKKVISDHAAFNFEGDPMAFVPYVRNFSGQPMSFEEQFANSFENPYVHEHISKLDTTRLAFLPLLVQMPSGRSVCITESDLESYPGMYLTNSVPGASLKGVFAPYPKSTKVGGNNMRRIQVTEAEDYIATISGPRTFPWRAMIVADNDIDLTNSDMVYKLAEPSRVKDISWIKPGKVAWEWWNDWGIYGVDFKAGVNTETYKYYVDFAAENHIEYVILDEGWSVLNSVDLMQVVPDINLKEIIEYARTKNVGIILWASYAAFAKDIEGVCAHYARMGIKGFKVDFMDRDDQAVVDFIYKAAQAAADHKLILDLHGMYKPTGLNRTYPNIVNFEGVFGLETAKWTPIERVDQVVYDVTIPFIRQVAGPMDYTQGAMRNATRESFVPLYSEPMSPGTRCRQLAQYVIFESPLNMLCDSPVKYRKEQECLNFITEIPTVWDQTVPLAGKISEYVVMARRKDKIWYIGGITDWTARTLTLDLSMLPSGSFEVELFRDGVNADKYAQDYKREVSKLPADRKLTIHLAPGGGFAAIIRPVSSR